MCVKFIGLLQIKRFNDLDKNGLDLYFKVYKHYGTSKENQNN
jgi:hypothetical protein